MMDQIVHWVREDPSGPGRPQLLGTPAAESMAVPMMVLSLVEQLGEADEEMAGRYAEVGDWCAHRILQHIQVSARAGVHSPRVPCYQAGMGRGWPPREAAGPQAAQAGYRQAQRAGSAGALGCSEGSCQNPKANPGSWKVLPVSPAVKDL